MSIFNKAIREIEPFSNGIKEISEISKNASCISGFSFLEDRIIKEHCDIIDESVRRTEKEYDNRKLYEPIIKKQLLESQILNKLNSLNCSGRDILFKEILFEIFEKSLHLDEDFISENYENLKFVTNKYIDDNGGYKLLENAINKTGSPILKSIYSLCEATAKRTCKRKIKECNSDVDRENSLNILNFDLDDEEKEDFDLDKTKLGIDELSDLVKSKVLTVVQDEKQRQEKEESLIKDIEDDISNKISNDDNQTEENVKEALNKLLINKKPIEETTLFNALLRHSYKELLESIASLTPGFNDNIEKDKQRVDDFKFKTTNSDVSSNDKIYYSTNDVSKGEYNLNKEVEQTGPDEGFVKDEEYSINMDLVLAEAITKYTLMELLYTIQLEQYSHDTIRKISEKLIH